MIYTKYYNVWCVFLALLSSALNFDNFLSNCKTRWVHTRVKNVFVWKTQLKCVLRSFLSPQPYKNNNNNNKYELLHLNSNWTINTRKQWIDFHHSLVFGFRCLGPFFATHQNYHLNVNLNRFHNWKIHTNVTLPWLFSEI